MGEICYNGKCLRQIRLSRNMDLSVIAEKTRISKRYLQYIEDDEYGYLPSLPYLKGYLEQYAVCLGLEPRKVVMSYIGCLVKWANRGDSNRPDFNLIEPS